MYCLGNAMPRSRNANLSQVRHMHAEFLKILAAGHKSHQMRTEPELCGREENYWADSGKSGLTVQPCSLAATCSLDLETAVSECQDTVHQTR